MQDRHFRKRKQGVFFLWSLKEIMKCMFLKKQYRSCTCMLKYQTWACTLYIIDIRQTGILKESIGIYFFSDTKKKKIKL